MRILVAPFLLFASCLEPTEIKVVITTNAACADVRGVSIAIGTLAEVNGTTIAATAQTCDKGNIGSIVMVPSTKKEPAAIRVVMGVGKTTADQCIASGFKGGCIVARRQLGYVQHRALVLPIDLQLSCVDVPCDATTTCVNGQCVPAKIDNCDPVLGCVPGPGDGGIPPTDAGDAGPPPLGAIAITGAGIDVVTSLAVDPGGGIYAGGRFGSPGASFGGKMATTTGQSALYVVRYEPPLANATWLYVPTQSPVASNGTNGLAANAGGVLAVGSVIHDVDLGNGTVNPPTFAAFYASLKNGMLSRGRVIGGNSDIGIGAAFDNAGNVYIVGQCNGPTMVGGGSTCGPLDAFIASYDSADNLRWSRNFGSPKTEAATSIAISNGLVIVGGVASGPTDFGSGIMVATAASQFAFLAAYDTQGNYKWERVIGSSANAQVRGVASDGVTVFASGFFDGTIMEGNTFNAQSGDGFVWAVDLQTGKGKWLRQFGGPMSDLTTAIASDGAGGALVCGSFTGTANLGSGNVTSTGPQDIFVAHVAANNASVSVKTYGGPGADDCFALVSDDPSSLVIGGDFAQSIVFGQTTLAGDGSVDGYVARIPRP